VLRHVSRERRPGDRGRGLGAAHADAVALTVTVYRRLLREAAGVGRGELRRAGETVGARLEPDQVDELDGIAAGAGCDVRELLAINARTELLAGRGGGECSLLGRRAPDGAWLAQTWDWHPALAPAALAWTVGSFTTVTEAGILAKLGQSRAGLAVGLNFLTCTADGGLDGVPIHVVARLLLDRCATGAEARDLLAGVRCSASSCLTVAAGDDLFSAELSPGGTRIVEADPDGWLVHTNHFLLPPLTGRDTQPDTHPGTLARRARLARAARAGTPPLLALAEHAPESEPLCRHGDPRGTPWAERRRTLLALWAQPARRSLRVAAGPPCSARFVDVA
jgi:isopenicillin-N N-acyltransferase-like protein